MAAHGLELSDEFYHDADLRVVQLLRQDERDILHLGCGEGWLGEVLKHLQPDRRVTGIEPDRQRAGQAAARLDAVVVGAMGEEMPAVDAQSFDCIVIDGGLTQRTSSCAFLERLRPRLRSHGRLLLRVPNPQHWSRLDGLFAGTLPADTALDSPALAISNLLRLCLDAGFLPRIVDRRLLPAPAGWLEAQQAAVARQGLDAEAFAARAQTWHYFIEARPIAGLDARDAAPVSIGVCTHNPGVLQNNLMASPCVRSGPHELLTVEHASSAAEGLNAVIAQAQHELVVLVHQDVYLPSWWVSRLWQQYAQARALSGDKVGVMGVYGVLGRPEGILHAGRVCDRDHLLDEPVSLPAPIGSLDELVLIVPRQTPLRFDPALGFHLYGTDICLEAGKAGLFSLAIDAPCHHNSRLGNVLPPEFAASQAYLRAKWPQSLPIATPCAIIR